MTFTPPAAQRPTMPVGYGLPLTIEGLLTWPQVEERLVEAGTYWLATVRPDGRPHVVPRWGVWVAGCFFYDGASTTRHAQNLAANPACALHLESGTQAVIVEGVSRPTHADPSGLGVQLATAFSKYHGSGYAPGADAWTKSAGGGGLRVLTPQRALAWFAFPQDATRFRFD